MRPRVNLILFLAGAFFLSYYNIVNGQSETDSQNTEKIKIISAYCLNNQWQFNILDGVKNKTSKAVLGRRNAEGFLVESFDESTQTAVISTPRGKFVITMQMPTSATQQTATQPPKAPTDNADISNDKTENKISRRRLLNLIK